VLPQGYEDQNCSVARTLEVIGERWSALILRDALLGIRRFEDFRARLGISRTVLSTRLDTLVDHGVLERERYQRRPDRYEYVLTEKGADLWPALHALAEWGNRYAAPDGKPRRFVHEGCVGDLTSAVVCPDCQRPVAADDVLTEPGPGAERRPRRNVPIGDLAARRHLREPVRERVAPPGSLYRS
jgi:DNA-binding HxlR family transcriptional regulator